MRDQVVSVEKQGDHSGADGVPCHRDLNFSLFLFSSHSLRNHDGAGLRLYQNSCLVSASDLSEHKLSTESDQERVWKVYVISLLG